MFIKCARESIKLEDIYRVTTVKATEGDYLVAYINRNPQTFNFYKDWFYPGSNNVHNTVEDYNILLDLITVRG